MIIIAGSLRVATETRDAYLAGCRSVTELARSAPGCLDFALSPDPVDPGRVNVYERWESDAALERFRKADAPAQEEVGEFLEATVQRYRISGVEAP
ncbi:antibiotic biosynthesis monooxygenase [Streptomyces sp. AJS327]|uniref:putative quinol monooxygenase n=1 Tax=Streptomyces sp. AJS327 TaxID=2545265 RepID=UPI0015DF16EB|nr:antibiotic biosynthesis monooxygenase family protein [Streptomyces sp. AJS327]MBA0049424.1 antibiotic biosynthesis monooxygenase [Streptomyces sp. AJS327]